MQFEFWQKKWETREIGFHESNINPSLIKYFKLLNLNKENTVFIPLCGKTLDIHFFLENQIKVIGCEICEIAVKELFEELNLTPQKINLDNAILFKANNIEIFLGDFFSLNKGMIGKIDAIYDRASLVALPLDMRKKYTQQLLNLSEKARQLLVVLEYNQEDKKGPPFSIRDEELNLHYEKFYKIERLDAIQVEGKLGKIPNIKEKIYFLRPY